MGLKISNPGVFDSSNTALQGNLLKITFPLAYDKNISGSNNATTRYEYSYTYRPIHCGEITEGGSGAYIYIDTDPNLDFTSPWAPLNYTPISDTLGETFLLTPTYVSDIEIQYSIRALDDFSDDYGVEVLKTSNIYLIINRPATLEITSLSWDAGFDIDVLGNILDIGFSTPVNYTENNFEIVYADSWSAWRSDLSSIFGNIKFAYYYKFGSSPYDLSELISANAFFSLNNGDRNKINFKINNTDNTFNKDQSYYFQFFLQKEEYNNNGGKIDVTLNPKLKTILLLQTSPVFQIRKGRIEVNMPKDESIFTGGGIFAHGPFTKSKLGINNDGRSIALYDYHVPPDKFSPADKPSIGFFDTEHNEIGYLQAEREGSESFLTTNFNLKVNANIYENNQKLSDRYVSKANAIFEIKQEEFTATQGQKNFVLTKGSFEPNTNKLKVFIYGVRQPNTAFIESQSGAGFNFVEGLAAGDKVLAEWIQAAHISGFTRTIDIVQTQSYDSAGNTIVTFNDGSNITIQKGNKGDKGDKGDTGEKAEIKNYPAIPQFTWAGRSATYETISAMQWCCPGSHPSGLTSPSDSSILTGTPGGYWNNSSGLPLEVGLKSHEDFILEKIKVRVVPSYGNPSMKVYYYDGSDWILLQNYVSIIADGNVNTYSLASPVAARWYRILFENNSWIGLSDLQAIGTIFDAIGPQGKQGIQGDKGDTGKGFVNGYYDASSGKVFFTSNDGLGFSTGDLRGEISGWVDGGKPWSFNV